MEKSKLLQVLRRLEKREISALRKFLHSPFFNTREDVRRLYEFLLPSLHKPQHLVKEKVFHTLFPDRPYSDRDFHLLVSYLFKLVEKYLATREFLQDELEVKTQLMKSYRQRHLPGHFQYTVGQLRRALHASEVEDSQYYERQRDIYWEEYQMKVATDPSRKLNLEELTRTTEIAFFAQKMRQICLLTAQRSVYTIEDPLTAQLPFFDYLEAQELTQIPTIGIYFHGYYLLRGEGEATHFPRFKILLFDHSQQFSLTETRELYLLAVNFCVRQVNEGNRGYFREMFELYQRGLELEVLLENGQLSRFTYHNAVASAIQIQSFDWARQMIVEYRDKLEAPSRKRLPLQLGPAGIRTGQLHRRPTPRGRYPLSRPPRQPGQQDHYPQNLLPTRRIRFARSPPQCDEQFYPPQTRPGLPQGQLPKHHPLHQKNHGPQALR